MVTERPPLGIPVPVWENRLRSIMYFLMILWAVALLIFPSVATSQSLEFYSRFFWAGFSIVGSVAAFIGSVTKIEFRLELPGLIFMLIGPGFYAFLNLLYIAFPGEAQVPGTPFVSQLPRIAVAIFSVAFGFANGPRLYRLNYDRKQWARNKNSAKQIKADLKANTGGIDLTPEQASQPGAFPELDARRAK